MRCDSLLLADKRLMPMATVDLFRTITTTQSGRSSLVGGALLIGSIPILRVIRDRWHTIAQAGGIVQPPRKSRPGYRRTSMHLVAWIIEMLIGGVVWASFGKRAYERWKRINRGDKAKSLTVRWPGDRSGC